ncbi:filamentous hemagglutinin family outer membrane domain protein [Burkholderia pseudomallei MSHR3709]|nr:filamentous hemagglutinin family outer membrane domain protein [Burkholderia pseudomallei MSHR3709]
MNRRRGRFRTEFAAVVDQCTACGHVDVGVRRELAAQVRDRVRGIDAQASLAGRGTSRVVDRLALQDGLAVAGNRARFVADRARTVADRQRARADVRDRAAVVVDQRSRRERQIRAARLDQTVVRVIERVGDRDRHRAGAGLRDRPAVVQQRRTVQRDRRRIDRALGVVQRRAVQHGALPLNSAAGIRKMIAGVDGGGLSGVQRAVTVVDALADHAQVRVGRHRAAVRDRVPLYGHVTLAADDAARIAAHVRADRVGECASRHHRQAVRVQGNQPAGRIVDRCASNRLLARALNQPGIVLDRTPANVGRAL